MSKKIHLGCGEKKIEGFLNVDIRPELNPDIIDDISKLNKIENSSVNLIYACHVLEHFGRHEYKNVLKRWYEILSDGGTLRISVPDFEKVVEYYNKHKNLKSLLGFLYGGQNYPENFHFCTFDFLTLESVLKEIGFSHVKTYDWRKTEHSFIDDYSQAYIPHMDKENGMLMSLNIEAIK
jgi:predicted SAM-dependent methyltransferase